MFCYHNIDLPDIAFVLIAFCNDWTQLCRWQGSKCSSSLNGIKRHMAELVNFSLTGFKVTIGSKILTSQLDASLLLPNSTFLSPSTMENLSSLFNFCFPSLFSFFSFLTSHLLYHHYCCSIQRSYNPSSENYSHPHCKNYPPHSHCNTGPLCPTPMPQTFHLNPLTHMFHSL